ncbi:transcriptional regulator [Amycolatopsis sp. NPDC059090]|uniref:transcriptional regulator n=1 Tax=unclassified Amycolatopsis TaxID=2618356 RepID=UPI00366F5A51
MTGTVAARRDALLDSGTRLAMCALLQGAERVEFGAVREIVGVADSSVSKNARILEDAGYLEVDKGAVGRRPRTWFRLTPVGHAALGGHLAWLEALRRTARPPRDAPDGPEPAE